MGRGVAVELRAYRPADLDAMVALDDVCFAAPFRFSREAMRNFAEAKRARVVVAEADGALAGFAVLHVGRGAAYVVTLDVAREHRRAGLATKLMDELAAQARSAGCSEVRLHVHDRNQAALRFYERRGFVLQAAVQGFYGNGLDALEYRMLLGPG
jgi:ribosomal-protein-alanine N-acetyltransferase